MEIPAHPAEILGLFFFYSDRNTGSSGGFPFWFYNSEFQTATAPLFSYPFDGRTYQTGIGPTKELVPHAHTNENFTVSLLIFVLVISLYIAHSYSWIIV